MVAKFASSQAAQSEMKPLISKDVPQLPDLPSLVSVCGAAYVGFLVLAWCVLDGWNSSLSKTLFSGGVKDGQDVKEFNSPLAVTFLQFLFMGVFFVGLWCVTRMSTMDARRLQENMWDARWPVLVATHVFSTFWLQAMMMPTQMMSLTTFAASRALQVPVAGLVRQHVMGNGKGNVLSAISLTTCADFLLTYSFLRMEGCICVWSGHGVWLEGYMLLLVYFLLLMVPAACMVLQESVMQDMQVHPLLMLAVQNVAAAVIFSPVLMFDSVQHSIAIMVQFYEVGMIVGWLCVQISLLSLVSVALIRAVDSYWAVALLTLRVVYNWGCQLAVFYVSSNELLSVAQPEASKWSLVMMLGCIVLLVAFNEDKKHQELKMASPSAKLSAEKPLAV